MNSSTSKDIALAVAVGIDVGTETTKCVLGSILDLEIVRNAHGGHSIPSSVTFRGKSRLIGEDASEARNADCNTVLHVGRLIEGGGVEDEDVLAPFYRFERGFSGSDGDDGACTRTSTVSVEYDGKRRTFTSEAMLAMLLGKIRRCVESTVARKTNFNDDKFAPSDASTATATGTKYRYVLALPPDASVETKAAARDAAYAAGCGEDVDVVNSAECTAAVYGRKFGSDADANAADAAVRSGAGEGEGRGKGRLVLVVDMGHSQTTASLLRLGGVPASASASTSAAAAAAGDSTEGVKVEQEETEEEERPDAAAGAASASATPAAAAAATAATLLSSGCNSSLGAGNVDVNLWHHFRDTVPGLAGIEPNSRRGQRLLDGCRRLKHLLSMLPSGEVTVETLGNDDDGGDVTLRGTRDLIRRLCKDEGSALASLIAKVVKDANANDDVVASSTADKMDNIASVEVLGGGCRIPFVQDVILESIGRTADEMTLSRSLDDTSVAMGAALLGESNRTTCTSDTDAIPIPVDQEKRRALLKAERAMTELDDEMAKLAEARNKIESHVLEMRSARRDGRHGSLLPEEELDALLTETDDWLLSDECRDADLAEMEAKLEEILAKSDDMCADYRQALKEEAEAMEREMEREAQRARAEREAAAGEDEDDVEDRDDRRLPKKRRMEIVMKNKAEANELFSDRNYRHAAARYVKAISHCSKFCDLSAEDEEEVRAVRLSLNLNLALAYMKLEKYDSALRSCNDALAIDDENAKALFRRASVYYEQKKYGDAKKDLDEALRGAPDDKALQKLNARIEQQLKKQRAKEKKMAQKMFG